MFNNSALVSALGEEYADTRARSRPVPRRRTSSHLALLARLPTTAFIHREAERVAPDEVVRQLRRTPPPTSPEPESPPAIERKKSTGSNAAELMSSLLKKNLRAKPTTPWKDPQPFEVFSAIERKDLIYLMEIRDRAFHLLLRRTGDATPLVHTMRIGQSHKEVAIVLLGAFSRWVNQLGDEDMTQPQTKVLLKALRANLKLAIDYGLQSSQSDLIASFLQTLVMSEGEKWVANQTADIALALRAGAESKPVHTADMAVRRFATKELGKAHAIATLEDYVANATVDLLMMGIWSIVSDQVNKPEHIPSWYFARDDRVQKAFDERIHLHKKQIERNASRQTKWQIRVLQHVMEGRNTTFHSKVEALERELDNIQHR